MQVFQLKPKYLGFSAKTYPKIIPANNNYGGGGERRACHDARKYCILIV
jgi:hypothetical protein